MPYLRVLAQAGQKIRINVVGSCNRVWLGFAWPCFIRKPHRHMWEMSRYYLEVPS